MNIITPNTAIISSLIGNIRNQPSNRNFLSKLDYSFIFQRMPNVIYYLQKVNLPRISLGSVRQKTPFADIPLGGDHIQYGEFPMTYIIDEDMICYDELLAWWQGLGPPTTFDETLKVNDPSLVDTGFGRTSDGILLVRNQENNKNFYFYFRDLYPLDISEVQFDTTDDGQKYIIGTATFEFSYFKKFKNLSDLQ